MGGSGSQPQAVLLGQSDHIAAKFLDLFLGVLNIAAHRGSDLHHRLVASRLNPLLQKQLALLDNLGVMCERRSRETGIYGLVFLFNADSESRKHGYRCLSGECSLPAWFRQLPKAGTSIAIRS